MTIGFVEYKTFLGREKIGLFTNYIKNLLENKKFEEKIPIFIEKGSFPQIEISQHLILIATGTGIAPIRHILWERYSHLMSDHKENTDEESGRTLLFFGCRNKEKDYLYGHEFELFKNCEKMK